MSTYERHGVTPSGAPIKESHPPGQAQLDPDSLPSVDQTREMMGLLPKMFHKLGPHDPLWESGKVLHICRNCELSPWLYPFKHNRRKISSGGIEGSSEARWTRTENYDFVMIVRHAHLPEMQMMVHT